MCVCAAVLYLVLPVICMPFVLVEIGIVINLAFQDLFSPAVTVLLYDCCNVMQYPFVRPLDLFVCL